jgi:hypothetical protein
MDVAHRQDRHDKLSTDGIDLLELAGNAHAMFEKEDPLEKARLLNFVRTARGAVGSFAPSSSGPFDPLAETTAIAAQSDAIHGQIRPIIRIGWGTRIRTLTSGVRVRSTEMKP